MKANVVRIGNSRGICLPKSIIDRCELKNVAELEVEGDALSICPAQGSLELRASA
ncbi:MAG: hypothetical protein LBV36_03810 [Chromatiales bacterium]|nr:hypothetical protein [Chromatiales bacterium]